MEKFFNIKCRYSGLVPNAIVLVCTVRALRMHGGGAVSPGGFITPEENEVRLNLFNLQINFHNQHFPLRITVIEKKIILQEALCKGVANLQKHISNGVKYGVPVVVAINAMKTDTENEWKIIRDASLQAGAIDAIVSTHWENGGLGAVELAETVIKACQQPQQFKYLIYGIILFSNVKCSSFGCLGFCTT